MSALLECARMQTGYPLLGVAWGPPGRGWTGRTKWVIRGEDSYALRSSVWSTAVSSLPSARLVQRLFSRPGQPMVWSAILDPSERAAAVWVTEHFAARFQDLLLAEEGRPTTWVKDAARWIPKAARAWGSPVQDWDSPVRVQVSAVRARAGWFLGIPDGRSLAVFAIRGGKSRRLVDFDWPDEKQRLSLVRSRAGDAIAVMSSGKDRTARIYPVDAKTGRIGPPEPVSWVAPHAVPPPCTGGEQGWITSDRLHHPLLRINGPDFRGAKMRRQIVYAPSGACVAKLAGDNSLQKAVRLRDPPEATEAHDIAAWAKSRPTVPLVMHTDWVRPQGSSRMWMLRWEARCVVGSAWE